jgi:hypothetical protein
VRVCNQVLIAALAGLTLAAGALGVVTQSWLVIGIALLALKALTLCLGLTWLAGRNTLARQ